MTEDFSREVLTYGPRRIGFSIIECTYRLFPDLARAILPSPTNPRRLGRLGKGPRLRAANVHRQASCSRALAPARAKTLAGAKELLHTLLISPWLALCLEPDKLRQQLFTRRRTSHRLFHGFEGLQEPLLFLPAKHRLRERKEDPILFIDVSAKEPGVVLDGLGRPSVITLSDDAEENPPVLVLVEHDRQRPLLSRETMTLEGRKEVLFFLRVMPSVNEVSKKVNEPIQGDPVHRFLAPQALAETLEYPEGPEDHLVLPAEHGGGGRLSLLITHGLAR